MPKDLLAKSLGVVTCVAAMLAITPVSAQQKLIELNVLDTTPSLSDLPLLAMEQIAPEYNMKITETDVQGGGGTGQVFVGGAGDVMLVGVDTPVGIDAMHLADLKVIGNMIKDVNWGLVVPTDSTIKTLTDLKGKTVGISGPGALSELTLIWGLKAAGLDPDKDISRVALGSQVDLQAGLENHKVDASMLTYPALQGVLDAKTAVLLGNWAGHAYPGDVFAVRAGDLAKRRDDFVRFYNLFVEALNRMQDPTFALKMARLRFPHSFSDDELKQQLAFQAKSVWQSDGLATKDEYDSARSMWIEAGRFKAADIPDFDSLVVDLSAKK